MKHKRRCFEECFCSSTNEWDLALHKSQYTLCAKIIWSRIMIALSILKHLLKKSLAWPPWLPFTFIVWKNVAWNTDSFLFYRRIIILVYTGICKTVLSTWVAEMWNFLKTGFRFWKRYCKTLMSFACTNTQIQWQTIELYVCSRVVFLYKVTSPTAGLACKIQHF